MSSKTDIFKKVFGDGKIEINVKKRVCLQNPTVVIKDKKKEKNKKKCRSKFYE